MMLNQSANYNDDFSVILGQILTTLISLDYILSLNILLENVIFLW